MSGFCLTTVHRQRVLVKALIIVDCEPAPPQLSQVGWHLLTSADTCCHNMSQSADISSKHGHGMTWPLPSILYRAPPEDPGRSGRTNSWMHPWFHPWTHHRTYLNLLEPTWTPLEPTWTCIVCICNICNCIVFETYRLIVSSFVITRPVVPLFRPSLICSVCTSKKWQKSENLKSRSKAVQSHLFPRHGIVSTALHFTSTWLS